MDEGESRHLSIAEIAGRERALEQQIDAAVRNALEDTDSSPDERVDTVVTELREMGVDPNVDNIRQMLGDQGSTD